LADSPLRGESDLEQLGFAIMVWGPMALATFKGSHIALTTLLDKLPGLLRPWADLTIALASGGILGVVTWRLVEFGINQAERLVSTGILGIPIEPFIDFAAVGCGLMALVFLARVPEAVGKILKEQ
jgi:TRAP-type C4-dicarboxylate transport system permease small subunit